MTPTAAASPMEIDIEPIILEAIKKLKSNGGSLVESIELLAPIEKSARSTANLAQSTKILSTIVDLCLSSKDWKALNEQIVLLSKKRGQMKQAIAAMVQKAVQIVEELKDETLKLSLIETLRTVTLGKIYVEVERARLTRALSRMKEAAGEIKEAADVLFELQIETFGSMDKTEKIDFLLDQMRLGLDVQDFMKTQIMSRKINIKYLNEENAQEKKLVFYDIMIQVALSEQDYLQVAKHYMQIYDTKIVKENRVKMLETLRNMALFVVLAPYSLEQSDFIHRVNADPLLSQIPLYKNLLVCFITKELMRWPIIEQVYFPELSTLSIFSAQTESGRLRWLAFKDRVMEHNIRMISVYYNRITFARLMVLLDSDEKSSEEALSKLVVQKTIYAKLDRPAGMVYFQKRQDPNDILNEWSTNTSSLLELVVKVNHLIAKEEVVHQITHS